MEGDQDHLAENCRGEQQRQVSGRSLGFCGIMTILGLCNSFEDVIRQNLVRMSSIRLRWIAGSGNGVAKVSGILLRSNSVKPIFKNTRHRRKSFFVNISYQPFDLFVSIWTFYLRDNILIFLISYLLSIDFCTNCLD